MVVGLVNGVNWLIWDWIHFRFSNNPKPIMTKTAARW